MIAPNLSAREDTHEKYHLRARRGRYPGRGVAVFGAGLLPGLRRCRRCGWRTCRPSYRRLQPSPTAARRSMSSRRRSMHRRRSMPNRQPMSTARSAIPSVSRCGTVTLTACAASRFATDTSESVGWAKRSEPTGRLSIRLGRLGAAAPGRRAAPILRPPCGSSTTCSSAACAQARWRSASNRPSIRSSSDRRRARHA